MSAETRHEASRSTESGLPVVVIGAGGAGLRAAIAAAAEGVRVGLVCKSLLGKAHTVMAEGGVAAALANVDDRDSWRVHFADTMRGGQYVNNWRMAELHAKEAPARVRELEAWGALFDRTDDGRILQRNFGGHRYPRLAHVAEALLQYAEDLAASMLATTLGIEFNPDTAWDEREQLFKMSEKIVRTSNITQSAIGNKDGLWTTVFAACVFINDDSESPDKLSPPRPM